MDVPDRTLNDERRRELAAPAAGRIDAVVAAACPDLSRARVQRLIVAGCVTRNGQVVRKSVAVEPGDVIVLTIPPVPHYDPGTDLDLPVLYEDDALLAIDKPPGLAVHGAPGDAGPSVAGWFLHARLGDASAFSVERPGIVHRLDKDTSGVLVLARTPEAQASLSASFEARAVHKTYLALCDGVPGHQKAVIDAPIGRHPGDRTRMAVVARGRESRTEYEVLAAGRGKAFVIARPATGRTHQIRVHLAAVGAPVSGDTVYGRREASAPRQMLHAWQLDIPHPTGGRLRLTSPLPGDMLDAVRASDFAGVALPYSAPAAPVRYEEAAPV